MVVVVIMSILAIVGVSAFGKYLDKSRSVEGLSMLRSIAGAQERYRGENLRFLDASGCNGGAVKDISEAGYPTKTPNKTTYQWDTKGTDAVAVAFRRLGPTVSGPVQFGYVTCAYDAGAVIPATGLANASNAWAPAVRPEPFYVVKAAGDVDADGVQNVLFLSSFSNRIYQENEGE